MRNLLKAVCMATVVFFIAGMAHAGLTKIGTALYDSDHNGFKETYNLIYMDDGPFGPITWLDYTKDRALWQTQVLWADQLGRSFTVTLDPRYTSSVDWKTGWRLPLTDESKADLSGPWETDSNIGYGDGLGWGGPDANGFHDYYYGYNMVNSEMGQLYYTELGNLGYVAENGTFPQSDYGLKNEGDFKNLQEFRYWSGTEYSPSPSNAWHFAFSTGDQDKRNSGYDNGGRYLALVVCPGEVSAVPLPGTIPEPTTMLLLGLGLVGLAGARRKFQK